MKNKQRNVIKNVFIIVGINCNNNIIIGRKMPIGFDAIAVIIKDAKLLVKLFAG